VKTLQFDCPYTLKLASSITEFKAARWNALVRGGDIPFLEYEWLAALEESDSASAATGWHPLHLSLWEKDKLLAAAPLFLKNHSEGEFVWDYMWAEAASSLGRPWYPKLVGTVPATPAEGYRFLADPDGDAALLNKTLLDAAEALCRSNGIAGLHLLFTDPAWAAQLPSRGYYGWKHSRYIWENKSYQSFDDYLAAFTKYQRKNIRKEYGRHEDQGIEIRMVENPPPEYFDAMFELYSLTNDKFIPWDARWVNEDFFKRIAKTFARRIVFSEARKGDCDEALALAMMIYKNDRTWGRYWGTFEDVKDLHFAVCYYAPVDWCIRKGITYFDPGAGSPHKIRRGFRAAFDTSYHKFFDPVLDALFAGNIEKVNEHEERTIAALNAELPFKEA